MLDGRKIEEKKRFAGEKKPSMKRRSETHDYRSKRFYMITLEVTGRIPILGRLEGEGNEACIRLSPLGEAVAREWEGIPRYYPQITMVSQQVMPDHLHGILYVSGQTEYHLGQVIKGFKLGCNRALRRLLEGEGVALETQRTKEEGRDEEGRRKAVVFRNWLLSFAAIKSQPFGKSIFWAEGYNDKILHNYSTLDKWKAYLQDNPRRLAVKRAHPDFFRVRFGIEVAGQSYAAIGNRFLLQNPEKVQVQLSRSLTKEQIAERVQHFLTLARQGAILVSPAISEGEQAVMRATLDEHLPLIFLTPWGFNNFSKPGHQYYEACSEGRFLILAPWEHQNEQIPLTRTMCLSLNRMTKQICEL
jgi:hypothetical protein